MPQFGSDGGPSVTYMAPKMAAFKAQVHGATGLDLNVMPLQDKHLLACAVGLEGLGGILFVLDSDLGAQMLLTFLVVVTPCVPVPSTPSAAHPALSLRIMHDFWRIQDTTSHAYLIDMIMCFKNLAMIGSLLTYLSMKRTLSDLAVSNKLKTH